MEEKLSICKQYIIPEQTEHGITEEQVSFQDEGLRFLIEVYTREAGVRGLKREIAAICRNVAKEVASENLKEQMIIDSARVKEIRGR